MTKEMLRRTRGGAFCSVICLFLALLMVFYCFPAGAVSHTRDMPTEQEGGEETSTSLSLTGAIEVTSRRSERAKHFRLPDGSFVAVGYDTAVHFRNESGAWEEIDNTLSLTADGSRYATARGYALSFPAASGQDTALLRYDDGERSFSFSLEGVTGTASAVVENATASVEGTSLAALSAMPRLRSSVRYENVLNGVDIEYVLFGDRVYENVIIKNRNASSQFTFRLSMEGLSLSSEEDGGLLLRDSETGEAVFGVPASFMTDASEDASPLALEAATASASTLRGYSEEVAYTLSSDGEDILLTVTPSASWLSASERRYPVTVDPPLTMSDYPNVTDTYIDTRLPGISHGSADELKVGRYLDVYNTEQEQKSYLKLHEFPMLPLGSSVVGAQLVLAESTHTASEADAPRVEASYCITPFSEDTVPETAPATGDVIDRVTRPEYTEVGEDLSFRLWHFDITKAYDAWRTGLRANHGLSLTATSDTDGCVAFYSEDAVGPVVLPCVFVYYRSALGLDGLYTYTEASTPAGTLYLADAFGSFTLAVPTLSSGSALWNYTPTAIYRSARSGNAMIESIDPTDPSMSTLGYGWMMDFDERIVRSPSDPTLYFWLDADGTELAFRAKEGSIVCDSEDSLPIRLEANDNSTMPMDYRIVYEEDGAVELFSHADGLLLSRTDGAGNTLRFHRNASNRVTSVSLLPAGQTQSISLFTLAYEGTALTSITAVATGQTLSFTRFASQSSAQSTLDRLAWPDRSVNFEYADEESLSAMTRIFDTTVADSHPCLVLAYDAEGRVSSLTERVDPPPGVAGECVVGQSVRITYEPWQTVYRIPGKDDRIDTEDDLLTTYVFDTAARTVRSYTTDLSGGRLYGSTDTGYSSEEGRLISGKIQASALPVNLLSGGTFESTSLDFTADTALSPSGEASLSERPYTSRFGHRALLLSAPAYTSANAGQDVFLPAGSYTFSAYVKASFVSGERFSLRVQLANGTTVSSDTVFLPSHTALYPDGYRVLVSFTLATAQTVRCYFYLDAVAAFLPVSALVDNAQLIRGEGGAHFDYMSDGDMRHASGWLGGTYHSSGGIEGGSARVLSGSGTVERTVLTLPESTYTAVTDPGCQSYLLSAFAKANSLPTKEGVAFRLTARATYYDVVTEKETTLTSHTDYNAGTEGWQSASLALPMNGARVREAEATVRSKARATVEAYIEANKDTLGTPTEMTVQTLIAQEMGKMNHEWFGSGAAAENQLLISLTVIFDYTGNANSATFDRVSLVMDESLSVSYEYTEDKVASISLPDGKEVSYTYTSETAPRSPSSVTATDGSTYAFTYDERGLMSEVRYTSPDGGISTVTVYTRNAQGNVTATETSAEGTGELLYEAAVYSTAAGVTFGALVGTTSYLGSTARSFYDPETGRLRASIRPNGTGEAYTYDDMGRLLSVLPVTSSNAVTERFTTGVGGVSYTYTAHGLLETVTTPTTTYRFTYDGFGNRTAVYADSTLLATYTYAEGNGKLLSVTYGGGFTVSYEYDALDRQVGITYNSGSTVYGYTYDTEGRLSTHTDSAIGQKYTYTYDTRGRMTEALAKSISDGMMIYRLSYAYDASDRVTETVLTIPDGRTGQQLRFVPTYDADGVVQSYAYSRSGAVYATADYTYDAFGRMTERSTVAGELSLSNSYTFSTRTVGDKTYTGMQIKEYTASVSKNGTSVYRKQYRYTYDANGNITKIQLVGEGGALTTLSEYKYDAYGRLIEEYARDIPYVMNPAQGTLFRYAYDAAGNITSISDMGTEGEGIPSYFSDHTARVFRYGTGVWGDVLTGQNFHYGPTGANPLDPNLQFNTLTYDALGNPLTYYGATNRQYSMTWSGRRLTGVTSEGQTASYTYNADGIRTSKTVNGVRHDYVLSGTQILAEMWTQNGVRYVISFAYDERGLPFSMTYCVDGEEQTLYYVYDALGSVAALVTEDGTVAASYTYNAWGHHSYAYPTASGAAAHNPFRYKGYYYDSETGFYYCNSRYYDPANARFISADGYVSTGQGLESYNMYAYCLNNPVNRIDSSGEFSLFGGICAAIAAVASAPLSLVVTLAVVGIALLTVVENPPVLPPLPQISSPPKAESIEKDFAPVIPKEETKEESKKHVHHIVAQRDARAEEARKILKGVDIDPVVDPRNLVELPQHYHAKLHTNAYYNYVTERLRAVAGDKAGVEAVLAELKAEILAYSAAGIRWE